MSLGLMFRDELKGFYKSKVMLFLWSGLPLLAFLIHVWNPKTEKEMPLVLLSSLVVSSISGTIASIMLTVSIIHEKSKGVYPLFLIRPLKRWNILMGKFFAVYTCIAIAGAITIAIGFIVDFISLGGISGELVRETLKSFAMTLSMMAISSSAGVLIGVLSPSVLVGVILIIYGGNQVSAAGMAPAMLKIPNQAVFSAAAGLILSGILLFLAVFIFERKQF